VPIVIEAETVAAQLSEIFVSIQGEGSCAGQRHLFVRFAGCNLRCGYCDTPYSLTKVPICRADYPDGRFRALENPVGLQDLAAVIEEICRLDPGVRMVAITGGEPMLQSRFVAEWLERRPPPVDCLLETNAILCENLERVLAHVAVVSADVKLPSNSGERAFWQLHESFLECCSRAGRNTYVKMPVDTATEQAEVRRGARLVSRFLPAATLFLQPIERPGRVTPAIDDPVFSMLVAEASAEVADVRISPQLHKLFGIR